MRIFMDSMRLPNRDMRIFMDSMRLPNRDMRRFRVTMGWTKGVRGL